MSTTRPRYQITETPEVAPGDPHHEAATAILLAGTPGRMLVHTITLAEFLVGGVRVGQGASILDDPRSAGIRVAPYDLIAACRMWQFITRQASQPLTTRSLPQHAQGACPLAQTAQLTQYDQLHWISVVSRCVEFLDT